MVAKEIVAEAKKKARPRRKKVSTEKLSVRLGSVRLGSVLERYKKQWDSKEIPELARQLREFADALETDKRVSSKKADK